MRIIPVFSRRSIPVIRPLDYYYKDQGTRCSLASTRLRFPTAVNLALDMAIHRFRSVERARIPSCHLNQLNSKPCLRGTAFDGELEDQNRGGQNETELGRRCLNGWRPNSWSKLLVCSCKLTAYGTSLGQSSNKRAPADASNLGPTRL